MSSLERQGSLPIQENTREEPAVSGLEKEIQNLQKFRATLEAIRQATENIYTDIKSAQDNQVAILGEAQKAEETLKRV